MKNADTLCSSWREKIRLKFEYGKIYEKYDMTGEIKIGTGVVKVHDIFNPMPEFMKDADALFCDPPYNQAALYSYYTKAEIEEKPEGGFKAFQNRLIEVIKEIGVTLVVLETGVKQTEDWLNLLEGVFPRSEIKESYYYKNKNNKCNIIVAGQEIPECLQEMPYMDEENVIKYLCCNLDYTCIADPCMGQGLVAFYSNMYGKKFVGTELNPKRLAVCVDRVAKGKK